MPLCRCRYVVMSLVWTRLYQSHATLSRKTSRQNLKFWWTSIISASLPIYLKKEYSLKPCSDPLVKIIILLSLCTARSLNTLALNIPWKKNEDVFRVFQRPFVCMNAPEINQTAREWRNYFCEYFSWGYGLNNTKPAKLITYNLTKL